MALSYIDIIFINFTITIVFFGVLINSIEPYLPSFIRQFYRYGKLGYKGPQNKFVSLLEVPKAWYRHFYIFATVWSTIGIFYMYKACFLNHKVPEYIINLLDFFGGGIERKVQIQSSSAVCAITLIAIQCYRRLYETQFLQIFSTNSKINIPQYLVGHLHYFGSIIAIFCNTEGFVRGSSQKLLSLQDIKLTDICLIIFFLYCCLQQYKCNRILSNLRRNKSGKIVTENHLLPSGEWFEYVSSPHMLFEILMYVSIFGIIPRSTTWSYVLMWVIANQCETAWLTHQWYKGKFKDFPQNRKAIIPFIL